MMAKTCPSKVGRKDDQGKRRWDLLPWGAVEEIVKVLENGAAKYGDFDWKFVPNSRVRYFAAAMRHMVSWWNGEKLDKEDGCSHLAHAACCIIFLMHNLDGDGQQEKRASQVSQPSRK